MKDFTDKKDKTLKTEKESDKTPEITIYLFHTICLANTCMYIPDILLLISCTDIFSVKE